MDRFPDELLVKTLGHLDFKDVATMRRVNKRFAEVGAEVLVRRVRFHFTKESLTRLKDIANHPVLSKNVESVVYEGNILANVACIHAYAAHYDLDHHHLDHPAPPSDDASDRESRLYARNMSKFANEISARFDNYRNLFQAQQELIEAPDLPTSLPHFPKLKKVVLFTVGRCKHVLSDRFLKAFATGCAMPVEHDTYYSKGQLKFLLFRHGRPVTTLEHLEAHVVSPKFFTGFLPRESLCQVFANLRVIELRLRLEKDHHRDLDLTTVERCYSGLSKGILRDCLASATKLEKLTVNFEDYGFYGPCTNLKNVLGDHSWPNLTALDIDCMSATQDQLITILTRQPALRDLRLGFFVLTAGKWTDTTRQMQTKLKLDMFCPTGLLEDPDCMYPMSLIQKSTYLLNFARLTMADALSFFVTELNSNDDYHPLEDESFADPELLRDEFGPFSDSESEDDDPMDCD
ncbi:hypothetical protein PV10_06258 [Exophiala mesophila]|uniref:F-box domain-containing protein n=1 Tax=Exophiala mesophila TaxID=212818 RepID=A0A0D1XU79_EXOME|nr:uncharacterized protein PV10_06258 [Exophiala mesophila]KIV91751.1 hypothetical protein PV10_06258 [Exophiala mesophila]